MDGFLETRGTWCLHEQGYRSHGSNIGSCRAGPSLIPGRCVRGEGARQVNGSARQQVAEGMAERRRAGQGGNGLAGPAAQRFLSTGQSRGDGHRPSTAARGQRARA